MISKTLGTAFPALFLAAASGCAAGSGSGSDEDPAPVAEASAAPEVSREVTAAPLNLGQQIDFARQDLAQRLGVAAETISLSGARPVNWRSAALGCPEPGMMYTQALVPGALIFLKVGDEVHGYHAAHGKKPFHCPRERAEQPVFGTGADQT